MGWYDGNPATLDPLPPRDMAKRTLAYMGGIEAVVAKAKIDFERGDYRWVVHILDQVIWAEPTHSEARELAAAAHTQLGYQAENATWRNAYLAAAQELRTGLPEGDKNHRALRDVMKGMKVLHLLDGLSIRLNGPKSIGLALTVNWNLSDSAEACHTELSNSVLVNRDGAASDADVTVTLPRLILSQFVLAEIGLTELKASGAEIAGDADRFETLIGMLDTFPRWFPIATHDAKYGELA